ncbi:MAG: membrane dipeptidase [Bacteroidaceae bacterium]|nr:membrane dipeptidase [Bacteroidaceae bacterium]
MLSSYHSVVSRYPNHKHAPLIGITGNFGEKGTELAEGYTRSVEAAGGVAVVLPPTENEAQILASLDHLDGLILSGGGDINPLLLGEEPIPELGGVNPIRDAHELLLTQLALDRQIPILGICRGMQVLVAALGGTIHQDIKACMPGVQLLKHSQNMPRTVASHGVNLEKGSILSGLLGEYCTVNSFHHQAVATVSEKLKVVGTSSDGVIEAVESTEYKSVMGVQWHPECFILAGNRCMLPIFEHLVTQARSFARAKALHHKILTVDSHCDTPMQFDKGIDFCTRDPQLLVDAHKMTEGYLDVSFMVAYLEQKGRSAEELIAATQKADNILQRINQMINQTQGFTIARTVEDLYRNKFNGLKSVVLGIENGYAIGKDLSNIARYKEMGVAYMTLCHNGDNDICDSARKSNQEHGGLSDFGKEVVKEMNRVGMLIDLSHASEKSFYDVLSCSAHPVACTHSSSKALCDHPRNLTDVQLRALAQHGGVAQVTFYNGFLRTDEQATIHDAVAHILHCINVAGIDHVGIGSDFDGDGGVPGLESAAALINLTRYLQAEGLSDLDLQKLWGGNFLRVLEQCKQ